MAEETGIEPVHTGVKTLGLSAWLFLNVSLKIARAVSRSGYPYSVSETSDFPDHLLDFVPFFPGVCAGHHVLQLFL